LPGELSHHFIKILPFLPFLLVLAANFPRQNG
jgi:hypothetical protein